MSVPRRETPRVLHLINDAAGGGGQRLILWLRRHGSVAHDVFALAGGSLRAELESSPGSLDVATGTTRRARLAELLRVVESRRPTVLHTHTPTDRPYGQLAALHSGLPLVHTFHGLTPMPVSLGEFHRQPIAAARRVANLPRIAVRYHLAIDLHLAVSSAARRQNAAEGLLDPAMIRVVPPGLPPTAFAPAARDRGAMRATLGAAGDSPLLLTVGTLVAAKGQREIPAIAGEILAAHPDALWVIAGEGPDRTEIAARIEAAGLGARVRLLGARGDVRDLLEAADLVVATSHSESFGLALVEALAAGRAVVGYRVDGYDDFLGAALAGWFVPVGATAELAAQAIRRLDQRADAALITAGRTAAARFTIEAMDQQLVDAYRSLPGRRRRAARK